MNDALPGWKIEQAMSAYQSARARLLAEDPDADIDAVLGAETDDVREILSRLLTAEQWSSAMADGAKAMIADMETRRHRFVRHKETARSVIFAVMEVLESRKEAFPHGSISISAGRPAAVIMDETALSDRFVTIKRVPNRAEIAAALKDGEVVDGAVMSNSFPVLTIRGR